MRSFKIDDLPARYRKDIERQLAGKDSLASKYADVEQAVGDALVAAQKAAGYNGQVVIRMLEKRHRLPDIDGSSCKYCIDSIVTAGVLQDDNRKIVTDIKRETIQIPKDQEEQTIIEIYAI